MNKIFGLSKPTLLSSYLFFLAPFTAWLAFSTQASLFELELFSLGGSVFSFIFISDFIRIRFSSLIAIISRIVLIFGDYYIKEDPFYTRFFWIVLIFVFSMNLLIFIPSLPALLLGWDGLGISSFALIIYYQNSKSLGAGVHTLLLNRIGDVLILLTFGLIVALGHWNILALWSTTFNTSLVILITITAITKRAQVPFSSWLPAAIAAPTPVRALVHSSTLVTAGIFLLIRFNPYLAQFDLFSNTLMFTAVLTSLLGGWRATYEYDLKKIIALSTLRQLGVIIFSLSLGFAYLTLFHLYTHALFKSILFICAGHILHTSWNNQDIRNLGNAYYQLPITTIILNLGNLCLIGAPFLRGFYSKDAILEKMLSGNFNLTMVLLILLATAFTAKYSIRLSLYSLWSGKKQIFGASESPWQLAAALSALATLALIGGKVIAVLLIFNREFIFLPLIVKFLVIFVVIFGTLLALTQSFSLKSTLAMKAFFPSAIWFLPTLITSPPIRNTLNFSRRVLNSFESGWVEPMRKSRLILAFSYPLGSFGLVQESVITKALTFSAFAILISLPLFFFS